MKLSRDEFERRVRERFYDPAFAQARDATAFRLAQLAEQEFAGAGVHCDRLDLSLLTTECCTRHLAGRRFAIFVHGDAAGAESLRRALHDWLVDMHLLPAGAATSIDRYIGYYEPYATSHVTLDGDSAVQAEVAQTARDLASAVVRDREQPPVGSLREDVRPK